MKRPKEPRTFKYPRLYWQPMGPSFTGRLRILYPDRPPEWALNEILGFNTFGVVWDNGPCCWFQTVKTQLEDMHQFDRDIKNPKAVFLGEIK